MIPINKPIVDEKEVEAVVKVLRSGLLTARAKSGSNVDRFEKAFAKSTGCNHAFAVNSGTAALHLSLLATGVGSGDEVIVPSFTFVSTAETVVLAGGKPIFVDIDPDTYNIDVGRIQDAISDKTKAIIPVDLFGLPANMKQIRELADDHGLVIVEDAAQAHGARYMGKPCGYFADLACWSFYASKNMTTGEGGMITTNIEDFAERIPYMRTHGEKEEYISTMVGHNYRMPEMEAAVGCVQLEKLPRFLKLRKRNADDLTSRLHGVERLRLPEVPEGYSHSWYLFTVKLKDATKSERDRIVKKMREQGVGAAVYYRVPIHLMPFYHKFTRAKLPVTERVADQVFSLPVHPAVEPEDTTYIAGLLKRLLE